MDIVISDTLTMLGYLFITMICFVYYSPDEIQKYNQPVINMLESIEFKFIERMEMLFIAFFILIFSLAWIPAMYMGVFCTSWLFGKQDHRNHHLVRRDVVAGVVRNVFHQILVAVSHDRLSTGFVVHGWSFHGVLQAARPLPQATEPRLQATHVNSHLPDPGQQFGRVAIGIEARDRPRLGQPVEGIVGFPNVSFLVVAHGAEHGALLLG